MVFSAAEPPVTFQEHWLAGLQTTTNRGGNGAAAAAAAASATPLWLVAGAGSSQPLLGGEPLGRFSHAVMEGSRGVAQDHHQMIVAAGRQLQLHRAGIGQATPAPERPSAATLQIISGDSDIGKEMEFQEPPALTVAAYSALQEYQGRFELALGQSMVCTNYGNADQSYDVYSPYAGQDLPGRMLLPPAPGITAEGLMYVNARQLNGIIRRRLARAKNRISWNRKPYLHESRHRHAMRRARGNGGRFLNTKNLSGDHGDPRPLSANTSLSSKGNGNNDSENPGGTMAQTAAQDDWPAFATSARCPCDISGGEPRWVTATPPQLL